MQCNLNFYTTNAQKQSYINVLSQFQPPARPSLPLRLILKIIVFYVAMLFLKCFNIVFMCFLVSLYIVLVTTPDALHAVGPPTVGQVQSAT